MKCDYETKLKYLNEYKEFLYEVWYQKIKATPQKDKGKIQKDCFYNFYMLFSAMAKNVLRPHFDDYTDEIITYQKRIENELESLRYSVAQLGLHCDDHDEAIKKYAQNILFDENEQNNYLKSQINNFRYIYYSPLTNKNRLNGIKAALKSECLLLLDSNPKLSDTSSDDKIKFWLIEIKDYLNPVRDFKMKKAEENEHEGTKHLKKYEVYFDKAKSIDSSLSDYEKQFTRVCEKMNIWSQIYEDPQFTYFNDYSNFRKAIKTHIKIYEEANYIPKPLLKWVEKYVDNRFEKLEVYKHGAVTTKTSEMHNIQQKHMSYLYKQLDEALIVPPEKLTDEFREDILEMVGLKAKYLCPKETYVADLNDLKKYFDKIAPSQNTEAPNDTKESSKEL